jgi:predicted Zn-dependent peptidase
VDLPCLAETLDHAHSVSIAVFVRAGSAHDGAQPGRAHLLEHLLLKRTTRSGDPDAVTLIENLGGSLQAFTSKQFTCFRAQLPLDGFEAALNLLSDLVLTPRLNAHDIPKVAEVVVEEIRGIRDDPEGRCEELLTFLLWEGTGLAHPICGTETSLRAITAGGLAAFHGEHYVPENLVVCIAGRLDPASTRRLGHRRQPGLICRETIVPVASHRMRVGLASGAGAQARVYVGAYLPVSTAEDLAAAEVLSAAIGEGMGSRLFRRLREHEGIAYEASSFFRWGWDELVAYAAVAPDRVPAALTYLLEELSGLHAHPPEGAELARARNIAKSRWLFDLENTPGLAQWMGVACMRLGTVPTVESLVAAYDSVSSESLHRLSDRYLRPETLSVVVYGPRISADLLDGVLPDADLRVLREPLAVSS